MMELLKSLPGQIEVKGNVYYLSLYYNHSYDWRLAYLYGYSHSSGKQPDNEFIYMIENISTTADLVTAVEFMKKKVAKKARK